MRIPKRYGESKIENCPFCDKQATGENEQGISVCRMHKGHFLELKCRCGCWFEIKKGKWGAYCKCESCGIQNLKRVLEMNPVKNMFPRKDQQKQEESKSLKKNFPNRNRNTNAIGGKKEITITSREVDTYFG